MNGGDKKGLGLAIINGIIRDGLVRAVEEGLCSWKANADEILEAIVDDWRENSRLCANCGNHVLIGGETDAAGVFVCNDCQ
jgi:hypothetical protein